jgi:hypothetical protein
LAAAPVARAQDECVGDCNGNSTVAINELILGVNIALDSAKLATCPAFDANGNDQVEVSELVAAVNNTLGACVPSTPFTATPTPPPGPTSPTATTTRTNTARPTDTATPSQPPPSFTPTVTPPPTGGDAISGGCSRPRAAGLGPCDSSTIVRAFRCDNRFTCTGGTGRTELGQAPVDQAGNWVSIRVNPPVGATDLLILEASVDATVYRVLDLGAAGVGSATALAVSRTPGSC